MESNDKGTTRSVSIMDRGVSHFLSASDEGLVTASAWRRSNGCIAASVDGSSLCRRMADCGIKEVKATRVHMGVTVLPKQLLGTDEQDPTQQSRGPGRRYSAVRH